MAVVTSCPSCRRQLRVPDELVGRQVKCPDCGTQFTASAGQGEAASVATPASGEGAAEFGEPGQYAPEASRVVAASAVKGPAICLIITGVLGILLTAYNLVAAAAMPAQPVPAQPGVDPQMQKMIQDVQDLFRGPLAIGLGVLSLGIGILVIVAGVRMMNLKSWGLSMAGSIVAMVPCVSPCCLLGLPIGIWSLVVLNKPEVKSAFNQNIARNL